MFSFINNAPIYKTERLNKKSWESFENKWINKLHSCEREIDEMNGPTLSRSVIVYKTGMKIERNEGLKEE